MLKIILLEDNIEERNILERIIKNRISVNETLSEYNAEICLSTENPKEALNFIKGIKNEEILAFIDINLKNKIDGIDIAIELRKRSLISQIVFLTVDPYALRLTIEHHIAPLDYITKNLKPRQLQDRIYKCLDLAYHRYNVAKSNKDQKYFIYSKTYGVFERLSLDNIYYIELLPQKYKKVRVFAKNKIFDCNGSLKDLKNKYSMFEYVDRKTLINLETVSKCDVLKGLVYWEGNKIKHNISVRRRSLIKQKINKIK